MEKEPSDKFCGILMRFLEVIRLQSFELSVSDIIPTDVQNISHLFFFAFFVSFLEKKLL